MPIDFSILNQDSPTSRVSNGILNRVQQMLDRNLEDKKSQRDFIAKSDATGVAAQQSRVEAQRVADLSRFQQGQIQNQGQQVTQEGQYQQGQLANTAEANRIRAGEAGSTAQFQQGQVANAAQGNVNDAQKNQIQAATARMQNITENNKIKSESDVGMANVGARNLSTMSTERIAGAQNLTEKQRIQSGENIAGAQNLTKQQEIEEEAKANAARTGVAQQVATTGAKAQGDESKLAQSRLYVDSLHMSNQDKVAAYQANLQQMRDSGEISVATYNAETNRVTATANANKTDAETSSQVLSTIGQTQDLANKLNANRGTNDMGESLAGVVGKSPIERAVAAATSGAPTNTAPAVKVNSQPSVQPLIDQQSQDLQRFQAANKGYNSLGSTSGTAPDQQHRTTMDELTAMDQLNQGLNNSNQNNATQASQ
jgi:hypothetical protein